MRHLSALVAAACLAGLAGTAAARTWQVPAEVPTVAAAIDSAAAGDVVELAPGVYLESRLGLKTGLTIRAADPVSGATIDAAGAGPVFAYAALCDSVSLVGLTLTGGLYYNGAAAHFASCRGVEIRGCTFVANRTSIGIAGALQVTYNSTVLVEDCLFQDNAAPLDDGGAVWTEIATLEITRCTFVGNRAVNGGAVSSDGTGVRITDCVFLENDAFNGGALDLRGGGTAVISGCLFVGNTATRGGAAGCWYEATALFVGCTMTGNSASDLGAGIYCTGASIATVERSLLAFNGGGGAVGCANGGAANLACSDVHGNVGGDWTGCLAGQEGIDGNFDLDPVFCSPEGDAAWMLTADSPCLSANSPCGQLVGAYGLGCGASGVPAAAPSPLLRLLGNHPNPFNPATEIAFDLRRPAAVDVRIYDLSGRLVRELAAGERLAAGRCERRWDGRDARGRALAAGAYLYRITAGTETAVGTMLLLK